MVPLNCCRGHRAKKLFAYLLSVKMDEFKKKIETHQQNKREAFDAMRAYHLSEISHKGHAIDILKSIMTTVLTVYAGLVVSFATDAIDPQIIRLISLLIFLTTSVFSHLIVWATNEKIASDNTRYDAFREEYKAERRILCLDQELLGAEFQSAWLTPQDRKRSGYQFTARILKIIAWSLTVVSGIATVFVFSISQ
jgi:phage shock protein PspC (stress-responsive transcriptional regulator)